MNDTWITQVVTLLTLIAGLLAQIYRERKKRRDDVEDRVAERQERLDAAAALALLTDKVRVKVEEQHLEVMGGIKENALELKVNTKVSTEAFDEANGTKREIADLQRQILHLQQQQPSPATAATAQHQAAQIDTIESETKQHTAQLEEIQKAVK